MPKVAGAPVDVAELAAERVAGFDPNLPPGIPFTLEQLIMSRNGFGLVTASNLQRAICRVLDGSPLGDLSYDKDVVEAFGDIHAVAAMYEGQPRFRGPKEMAVLSGIRAGKTIITAACAIHMALTCDVSGLVAGEIPRVSVMSLKKDLAQVAFDYITAVSQRPMVKDRLIDSPSADSIRLRHPSGRPVEIKVTAGARAGGSLVSRWSAGVIFDEAPRMVGADDGIVNLEDARSAVLGRMLPGAKILYPGSPWAPFGPVYEMYRKHFGKATRDMVVVKAPGWAMNPVHWTPAVCAALKEQDELVYATDVAAEFADKTLSFVPASVVSNCTNTAVPREPPVSGLVYVAAMDPATRGNSWTLGIAAKTPNRIKRLCVAKQWQGSSANPLSPSLVFEEMAPYLREYGVNRVHTDQWAYDSLRETAIGHGIYLELVTSTQQLKVDWFSSMRAGLIDKTISLVDVPEVAQDLKRVQRKISQTGITIELPRTNDGRHCDFAAMLALLFSRHFPDADESQFMKPMSPEEEREQRMIQRLEEETFGSSVWEYDL